MADKFDVSKLTAGPTVSVAPGVSVPSIASTAAPTVKVPPARPKRIVVDELREKYVTVVNSTVIFRPGQVLDNDHLIRLAADNNVLTREV